MKRRISGSGGAALSENGESRAHHTADGGLGDAREMFGEDAAIGKGSRLVRPVDSQGPAAMGLFGFCRRDLAERNLEKGFQVRAADRDILFTDEELRWKRRFLSQVKS